MMQRLVSRIYCRINGSGSSYRFRPFITPIFVRVFVHHPSHNTMHGYPLIFLSYAFNFAMRSIIASIILIKMNKNIRIISILFKYHMYGPIRQHFYILSKAIKIRLEYISSKISIASYSMLWCHRR